LRAFFIAWAKVGRKQGLAGHRLVADALGLGTFFAQTFLLVGFVLLVVVENKSQLLPSKKGNRIKGFPRFLLSTSYINSAHAMLEIIWKAADTSVDVVLHCRFVPYPEIMHKLERRQRPASVLARPTRCGAVQAINIYISHLSFM